MDAETRKNAQIVDRWLAELGGHERCEICHDPDLDIPEEAVYPAPNGEDIDEARENLTVEDECA